MLGWSLEIGRSAPFGFAAFAFLGLAAYALVRADAHAKAAADRGTYAFQKYLSDRRVVSAIGRDVLSVRWRPHFVMDAFFPVFGAIGVSELILRPDAPVVSSLAAAVSLVCILMIRCSGTELSIIAAESGFEVTIREISWLLWRTRRSLRDSRIVVESHVCGAAPGRAVLTARSVQGDLLDISPTSRAIIWSPAPNDTLCRAIAGVLNEWCESRRSSSNNEGPRKT